MSVELSEVVRQTLRGFQKAQKQHGQLTDGWDFWWAPEYLATVNIAEQVYKVAYVTIEQNIEEALRDAGKKKKAPAGNLPKHGRFDLVVWGEGDEGVKGIIEVKMTTGMTYGIVKGDVVRVRKALRHASNLEWGLIAYHNTCWDGVRKPARDRIETRGRNIEERAREYAERKGFRCSRHVGDMVACDNWASRAEVLAIVREQAA